MSADGPADRTRLVATTVALWLGAFVATALVVPPDPFTQLLYAVPFLLVSPPLAYWLVYRNGAERVRGLFGV